MPRRKPAPHEWPEDGLPPHVEAFVEWLVTPDWERPADEKTQAAYERKHGHGQGQTTVWKKDKRVRAAIEKRCDELNLDPGRIQEVMNAVFQAAKGGDMKAATLFLQHADKLKPTRIVVEDKRLAELSDDELTKELAAAGLLVEGD